MDILSESLEFPIVIVDGVKELKESFYNLNVGFLEVLVQFYLVNITLDLRVNSINVLQVA